jgi:hypothetical protein
MLKVMLSPALAFASGTMPVKPTAAAIATASKVFFTYFSLCIFWNRCQNAFHNVWELDGARNEGMRMGCHLIVKSLLWPGDMFADGSVLREPVRKCRHWREQDPQAPARHTQNYCSDFGSEWFLGLFLSRRPTN